MKTIIHIKKCLSCDAAPAIVTGLCNPCYYRFRYLKTIISLGNNTISTKRCTDCGIKLTKSAMVRQKSGTRHFKYKYMQTYTCKQCSRKLVVPP
jgi:hypothetical protein